ncbi:MAG: hypothetical protein U0R80_05550 [Nocardioidaceae bacterium]
MTSSGLALTGLVPGGGTVRTDAVGTPGLTQGGYGSRGNLELVVPGPQGGFTVCWFNSDPVEGPVSEPSIPAATWSAGLGVGEVVAPSVEVPAARTPYDSLAVLQARSGPDFLEVAALGHEGVDRWTWSPGPGFRRTGTWSTTATDPPELGYPGVPFVAETAMSLVVGRTVGSLVERWVAPLDGYPDDLAWTSESLLVAGPVRAAAADADGRTVLVVATEDGLGLVSWPLEGEVSSRDLGVSSTARAVAVCCGPDLVLAALPGGDLVAADGSSEPVALATGPEADALACCWSVMGAERHLEIAERRGSELVHRRWPVSR